MSSVWIPTKEMASKKRNGYDEPKQAPEEMWEIKLWMTSLTSKTDFEGTIMLWDNFWRPHFGQHNILCENFDMFPTSPVTESFGCWRRSERQSYEMVWCNEDFERTEYCQSRSCGIIKKLENEGVVKVAGERDKRTIRLIEG